MRVTLNINLTVREGIHESENNYQRIDERREVALALLEEPEARSRLSGVEYRVGDRTLHDTMLIVDCPHEPLVVTLLKLCIALRQPYIVMRLEDDGSVRAVGAQPGRTVKPEEVISY